jgi:archaemetzincin
VGVKLAVALVAVAVLAHPAAAAEKRVIYLQPLGAELPDADVAIVKTALIELYALEVAVLPRAELPRAAWYPPRRRWRAEKLLVFLRGQLPPDCVRVLGLTAADISTTKGKIEDWGVLGLGEDPGVAGVISTFRCHKRARNDQHARERLAKVAVHEIGHTLGLDHCPVRGCIMEDAEGSVLTSDREYDLCPRCRAQLAAGGRALPASPKIPWPKPEAP